MRLFALLSAAFECHSGNICGMLFCKDAIATSAQMFVINSIHHLYFPFFILIWLWSPQWSLEITENLEDIGAKSQWHGGFREAAGEQLTVTCTRQWQHPGLGRPFLVMLWHIKMGLPQLSLREMF